MPSKKPILQSVIETDIYNKFVVIAKKEKRSKSQLTAIAIEKFIECYEKEHGTIDISETPDTDK